MDEVNKNAKIIWDYMHMNMSLEKSDIILCIGGYDTSPANRAAELFLKGLASYLVFSGGYGKLTKHSNSGTEAEVYAAIARKEGVPENKIILESASTNTGENVSFTYALLERKKITAESIILVTKPYFERRIYATFKKQWPNSTARVTVTSPEISFEDYFTKFDDSTRENLINVMVGDFQRMEEYPKLGLQIEQDIPNNARQAYESLVKLGYTKHLVTSS